MGRDTLIWWLAAVIGVGTGRGAAVEFVYFGDGVVIEGDKVGDALSGMGEIGWVADEVVLAFGRGFFCWLNTNEEIVVG